MRSTDEGKNVWSLGRTSGARKDVWGQEGCLEPRKDVWSLGRMSRACDAQCDLIAELRPTFGLSQCVSTTPHQVVRSMGGNVTKEKFSV